MMETLILITGAFLLIASIIDWKIRALPSILLTAMLFTVAVMNQSSLFFGIMAFIVAYLLYESNFFSGVADIKVMAMLGFMLTSVNWLFAYIILTMFFGLLWKILIKWRLKSEKDTAFLPVFLFVYATMFALGGLA